MIVYLYKVGRNLNRAYRTCEAFGVDDLRLIDCKGEIKGNLFNASYRVGTTRLVELPPPQGLLAFETFYTDTIDGVEWDKVNAIILGGETGGLPRKFKAEQCAKIPMWGNVSGLTVEAALAIALYEWRA